MSNYQWPSFAGVRVNAGSKIVTIHTGESANEVPAHSALVINNYSPVEIESASGNQITLVNNWPYATISSNTPALAMPTGGDFVAATKNLQQLQAAYVAWVSAQTEYYTSTADTITRTDSQGNTYTFTTMYKREQDQNALKAQAESLVGSLIAPKHTEFDSRYDGLYAGVGFKEWGKAISSADSKVNQGVSCFKASTLLNGFIVGGNNQSTDIDQISNTLHPVFYGSNALMHLRGIARSDGYLIDTACYLKLAPAPDGLDKKDNSGRYGSFAEAVAAGGNSLTGSILDRRDLVLIEYWDEDVSKKGVLHPYGNVQFSGSIPNITLSTAHVAQGYSAMYVGDTNTHGKSFVYDPNNQYHVQFVQNKENNVRTIGDKLIQRKFRFRAISGLEGDWYNTYTENTASLAFSSSPLQVVGIQGESTTPVGLVSSTENGYFTSSFNANNRKDISEKGSFTASTIGGGAVSSNIAFNGQCWAVPLFLVPRLNKLAYVKGINELGCSEVSNPSKDAFGKWTQYNHLQTIADCYEFSRAVITGDSGSIVDGVGKSGRDDGMFYDAVTSGDVIDLRMSCHIVNYKDVNSAENLKNINSKARGKEVRRYTKWSPNTVTVGGQATYDPNNQGGSINFNTTASDNPRSQATRELDGIRVRKWYLLGSNGNIMVVDTTQITGSGVFWPYSNNAAFIYSSGDISTEFNSKFPTGTVLRVGACFEKKGMQVEGGFTAILAQPSVFSTVYPDGAGGEWLPVLPAYQSHSNGTGENEVSSSYFLFRKVISFISAIKVESGVATNLTARTSSVGISNVAGVASHYGSGSIAWVHAEKNEVGLTNQDTENAVVFVNYIAKSNYFEPAILSAVMSDPTDPHFTSYHFKEAGSVLCQSTIGKVSTDSSGVPVEYLPFTKKPYPSNTVKTLISDSGYLGSHADFSLPNTASPKLKHSCYITEKEGRLWQQLIGKEIKYDAAGGFGDNNLFEVVSGKKTKTDLNGQTVIYGCWERPLQYWTNNKVS